MQENHRGGLVNVIDFIAIIRTLWVGYVSDVLKHPAMICIKMMR
jgi:hypothetical protein